MRKPIFGPPILSCKETNTHAYIDLKIMLFISNNMNFMHVENSGNCLYYILLQSKLVPEFLNCCTKTSVKLVTYVMLQKCQYLATKWALVKLECKISTSNFATPCITVRLILYIYLKVFILCHFRKMVTYVTCKKS